MAALLAPSLGLGKGPGTTGAPFLKLGVGARATAMGGAFAAVGEDANALFWNPAGLATAEGREASLGFTRHFQGVSLGNAAYAQGRAGRALGLGAVYLSVPGISRRGTSDAAGIVPSAGTFDATDLAVTAAWARKDGLSALADGLDGGAALKLVRSTIDDKSATAVAADLGALYRAGERLRLAFGVQNLGTKLKFVEEADPLPLSVSAGAAWRQSERLLLAAQLDQYLVDEKTYASLGGEWWFRGALALRGGYRFGYDTEHLGGAAGLSLGVGVRVEGLGLDYAFLPLGDLGDTHRVGFWLKF